MFIIYIIRFFGGIVRFKACGDFVERFINLATLENLSIWNLKKTDPSTLLASTSYSHFLCFEEFSKKTDTSISIVSTFGFPFILKKYKKRIGVFIGLLICILCVSAMSFFIWDIEVVGSESIANSQIIEKLSELGLKKGSLALSLDVSSLSEKLMSSFDSISWCAINLSGSKATVEINEVTSIPDMIDINSPCDVIATESGIVENISVYTGEAVVKKGEAVSKGDVVATGVLVDSKGHTTLKHALASCEIAISKEYSFEIPLTQNNLLPTGKSTNHFFLNFWGLDIPIFLNLQPDFQYTQQIHTSKLNLFNLPIDISFKTITLDEVIPSSSTLTPQEARKEALILLGNTLYPELYGARNVSKKFVDSTENNTYIFNASISYIKDATQSSEIFVDNSSSMLSPTQNP